MCKGNYKNICKNSRFAGAMDTRGCGGLEVITPSSHMTKTIKDIFTRGGGGGGHSPQILVGMCRGKVKMGGSGASSSVKLRGSGASLSVKGVSGTDLYRTRTWLVLWPAANPGVLPERFVFGLAAVSRPWAAMNGLNVKKF